MSGKKALEIISERINSIYYSNGQVKMYKAMLIDYNMPEMDGPTLVGLVRELIKSCLLLTPADMPYICCCSAFTDEHHKAQAL